MFLCLPQHRCTSPLRELLHPLPEGGGHWSFVVKENFLPTFIVTLLPDASDKSTEYTLFSSDAGGLCRLRELSKAGHIVGIDCSMRTVRSTSWITRAVQEVWSVRGSEQQEVHLVFRDEPTNLFDAYTLRKMGDIEKSHRVRLLSISDYEDSK